VVSPRIDLACTATPGRHLSCGGAGASEPSIGQIRRDASAARADDGSVIGRSSSSLQPRPTKPSCAPRCRAARRQLDERPYEHALKVFETQMVVIDLIEQRVRHLNDEEIARMKPSCTTI